MINYLKFHTNHDKESKCFQPFVSIKGKTREALTINAYPEIKWKKKCKHKQSTEGLLWYIGIASHLTCHQAKINSGRVTLLLFFFQKKKSFASEKCFSDLKLIYNGISLRADMGRVRGHYNSDHAIESNRRTSSPAVP